MDQDSKDRAEHIFASLALLIEDNKLTDSEEVIVLDIEGRYRRSKFLSEKQIDLVENIYRRANAR